MMASTAIFAVLIVALVARVNSSSPRNIVHVRSAAYGELPYQASLRVKGQHYCSGAIITSRHIMTSAHCVASLDEPLSVVTGALFSFNGEPRKTRKIQHHQEYEVGNATSPYDIAIITLQDEIVFDKTQNTIKLPTAPPPFGYIAITSGWGYTNTSDRTTLQPLSKMSLPIISEEQCERMFDSNIHISENLQICTYAGNGVGICMIDGGGPLVYNHELIGVASFGMPCASGYPDVFTSVYHFMPWVNSIINA